MKICSLYGAGFYYIPGTDTCIKIGGWVRAEYNLNAGGSFNPHKVSDFQRDTADDTTRARAMITVDTRSQTEYGTLRSYIASGWNTTSGAATNTDALYVPRAFIQLAGFTAGKAQSFFDFYSTPAYSNTTNVWGSDTGGGGKLVLGYTAQLGNGLSATIAVEDWVASQKGISGGTYEAGQPIVDIVGNIRIDQAWGSAQVMGALHQVREIGTAGGAHATDKWGYAVGGGLKFNLPMLGKGDSFAVQAAYAEGAIVYSGGGIGSFLLSHGSSTGGGTASDSTVSGGSHNLTKSWSVVAGYQHSWNAQWKTSLYGTYGEVDPLDTTAGADASWAFYQIGSRTIWTPVPNLDLSVDVMYNKLKTAADAYVTQPTGNTIADQSTWQAIFRAQRNFWP